jgi:hypothetical protein
VTIFYPFSVENSLSPPLCRPGQIFQPFELVEVNEEGRTLGVNVVAALRIVTALELTVNVATTFFLEPKCKRGDRFARSRIHPVYFDDFTLYHQTRPLRHSSRRREVTVNDYRSRPRAREP